MLVPSSALSSRQHVLERGRHQCISKLADNTLHLFATSTVTDQAASPQMLSGEVLLLRVLGWASQRPKHCVPNVVVIGVDQ